MNRREFLQTSVAAAISATGGAPAAPAPSGYSPARITNTYDLFLPGEREGLSQNVSVRAMGKEELEASAGGESKRLKTGESVSGWKLLAILSINGSDTAVFEKFATHGGAFVYVTEAEGVIARIPKGVGDLSKIAPRPVTAPEQAKLHRNARYVPGPDVAGEYILKSNDDPSYENVAALGDEYIGWTLVANEEAGPLRSLYLEADGVSRQINRQPEGQGLWAPDVAGRVFDPRRLIPDADPHIFAYVPGYSKRTLLGGFLPAAHIGLWNPQYKAGYEVIVLLPPGETAEPIARVHAKLPDGSETVRYWNTTAHAFLSTMAGIWNRWRNLVEETMPVEIPDIWLLNTARAGIVLSRCSYRGLEPTYQIGEGAYTKIPERSHALFPVAFYEFVWAHQLWNLSAEAEPYVHNYLAKYVLSDGNFLYNTQDQVEAPLNVGIFLTNAARAYDYEGDLQALEAKIPVLRRMLHYVLERYEYGKRQWPEGDRRHGLIWGSPEADLGDPANDFPQSHPCYYQNATWTWRGLVEYSRCLTKAGNDHNVPQLLAEAREFAAVAAEMRTNIERSLAATIAAGTEARRSAAIPPFTPDDTRRSPKQLSSYENHRFMPDWFTADWGVEALDRGHLRHRAMAGLQILGLGTDGESYRVSNFMEHGTLSVLIRQDDYRPFLLALYGLTCLGADSGNCYAPEDAFMPGSYPGDGSPYGWSAVVNSTLQPTLALRWLLCYEENNRDLCHLQKAAPKHWFESGKRIAVKRCPTRFGAVSWTTEDAGAAGWRIMVEFEADFAGDLAVHVHRPDGKPLGHSSAGRVERDRVVFGRAELAGKRQLAFTVN